MAKIRITAYPARFRSMDGIRYVEITIGLGTGTNLASETVEIRNVDEAERELKRVAENVKAAHPTASFRVSQFVIEGRKPNGWKNAEGRLRIDYDAEQQAAAA